MMRFPRRKPLVAVAAALIVATTWGVAVERQQQPAPKGALGLAKPGLPTHNPVAGPGGAAAVNRALARKQLAAIDEAWELLKRMVPFARIEIDGGTVGVWGRRRLEALRRAGADKAEIVAALEQYIKDLEQFQAIDKSRCVRDSYYVANELEFLHIEAEIWLNEEVSR